VDPETDLTVDNLPAKFNSTEAADQIPPLQVHVMRVRASNIRGVTEPTILWGMRRRSNAPDIPVMLLAPTATIYWIWQPHGIPGVLEDVHQVRVYGIQSAAWASKL